MDIRVVCQEGFSPQYTGGGGYLNGIYHYLHATDVIKPTVPPTYNNPLLYPAAFLTARHRLKTQLKTTTPDCDLIHNNNILFFPHLTHHHVITTVHHLHFRMTTGPQSLPKNLLYYPSETLMLHASNHIISVSTFTANLLHHYYGIPHHHITVIPNGIDHTIFTPHNLTERPYIVFPNALRYPSRKGTYFLLPILLPLLQHTNLECWITGAISDEGRRILPTLPQTCKYVGFLKPTDLAQTYEQARCVVFPSTYEGFGLVPLEVIATGGIIVSADVGAAAQTIHNHTNGYLLPPNPTTWKKTLTQLIHDADLREHIRTHARQTPIRSWKDCANDHLNLFHRILQ